MPIQTTTLQELGFSSRMSVTDEANAHPHLNVREGRTLREDGRLDASKIINPHYIRGAYYKVKEGDFLMVNVYGNYKTFVMGPIGEEDHVKVRGAAAVLRGPANWPEALMPQYLALILSSRGFSKAMESTHASNGHFVRRIAQETLNAKFYIPSIERQQKAASIGTTVAKLLESHRRSGETMNSIVDAVLQEIRHDAEREQGLRPPKEEKAPTAKPAPVAAVLPHADVGTGSLKLDDGKYEIVAHPSGKLEALRYGEPWRDLTGDNLVYQLLVRVQDLENAAAQKSPATRPAASTESDLSP